MKLEIFQYFLDFNLLSCMDTVKNIVLTQLDHIKKKFKTHFICFLFYHTQRANLKHFSKEVG